MSEDLYLELIQSIKNVFNSDYSTTEISNFCETSYTAISELRRYKRDIMSAGLKTCLALYRFAVLHHINEEYLKKEKKKGSFHTITLPVPMNRIVVAQNPLDLFAYGFFKITYPNHEFISNSNELTRLETSDSVFLSSLNRIYHCDDFELNFKCGYTGTGPKNFVSFLENHSKINKKELEDIIFNHMVVEYNLSTDTLTGYPSLISNKNIELYFYNRKLIIVLKDYCNSLLFKKSKNLKLVESVNDILFFQDMLNKHYGFSVEMRNVLYIPECVHSEEGLYTLSNPRRALYPEDDIFIVLEYDEFEIWLPYNLCQTKGDIFSNEEMVQFLNHLGITIDYAPVNKRKLIEDIQVLPIE